MTEKLTTGLTPAPDTSVRGGNAEGRSQRAITSTNSAMVSVIIIFFNAERFLGEAIDSVFAQTFTGWELLLVDDGSSDRSEAIAREWARREPSRVRCLMHPGHVNRGMSATRNLGVAHAAGEYIAFLDADDVWEPRKLEEQVAILQAEPAAAMVQGAPLYWYGWTGTADDAARDYVAALPVERPSLVQPPALMVSALTGAAASPWPSDVLLRRRTVDLVGGFEDAFRGMHEDFAFFAKVQLRHPIHVATQTWLKYRQHDQSCYSITKRNGQRNVARLAYLQWLDAYLRRQDDIPSWIGSLVCEELDACARLVRGRSTRQRLLRGGIRRASRLMSRMRASW